MLDVGAEIYRALAILASFSLIADHGDRYSIHRLDQYLTRDDMERRGEGMRHADAAHQLIRNALVNMDVDVNRTVRLLPHLTANADHLSRLRPGRHSRIRRSTTCRRLSRNVSWIRSLQRSGRTTEAVRFYGALLADQARSLGNEHRDTLVTGTRLLACLGAVANDETSRLLNDQEAELNSYDRDALGAHFELIESIAANGNIGDAINRVQHLIAVATRRFSADSADVLAPSLTLARWLRQSGRYDEAMTLLDAVLPMVERRFGPFHQVTLAALNDRALILAATGRIADAVRQLEQVLSTEEQSLGPDDPLTHWTRTHLSVLIGPGASQLRVNPPALHFGKGLLRSMTPRDIVVDTVGREPVSWSHSKSGSFFTTQRSGPRKLAVTITGPQGRHRGSISITSAAGGRSVEVTATVQRAWPWWRRPRLFLVGAIALAIAGLMASPYFVNRYSMQQLADRLVHRAEQTGWQSTSGPVDGPKSIVIPCDETTHGGWHGLTLGLERGGARAELHLVAFWTDDDAQAASRDFLVDSGGCTVGTIDYYGTSVWGRRAFIDDADGRPPFQVGEHAMLHTGSIAVDVKCWGAWYSCGALLDDLEELA